MVCVWCRSFDFGVGGAVSGKTEMTEPHVDVRCFSMLSLMFSKIVSIAVMLKGLRFGLYTAVRDDRQ